MPFKRGSIGSNGLRNSIRQMLAAWRWSDFEDGRALAVSGHYAEALAILERSFRGYQSLHLEADVGPGPGEMQAWIAEAQMGTGKLAEAQKNFEAAAKGLAEDQDNFDDARCDLAMVEAKIGNVLLKMGKTEDARAHFQKALEAAKLEESVKQGDFSALYAAAEAYTGEGDRFSSEARKATGDARWKLRRDARASYEKSLEVWKQIPIPSRLSGNDFLATTPQEISLRLAHIEAERAQLSAQ